MSEMAGDGPLVAACGQIAMATNRGPSLGFVGDGPTVGPEDQSPPINFRRTWAKHTKHVRAPSPQLSALPNRSEVIAIMLGTLHA